MINENDKRLKLIQKIDILSKKYTKSNEWNGSDFPTKIEAEICGLPQLKKEKDDNNEVVIRGSWARTLKATEESMAKRNAYLFENYGLYFNSDNGKLYNNKTLKKEVGSVIGDQSVCMLFKLITSKKGITPIGKEGQKLKKLIQDAESVEF